MKLSNRVQRLEERQPSDEDRVEVVFIESVQPSPDGPVSDGLKLAYVLGCPDTFQLKVGEAEQEFVERVLQVSEAKQ